ncbi:MAG: transporter substrate-binding domain-containing protein [Pseudodesulfovibrio sp.]|nr:transporter substrate-binding domain-containing protein [Pseudodesulfovibrio sp.]
MSGNSKPTGLLISKVDKIMEKAGIKVDYTCYPSKRVLYDIQQGVDVASIGWFKTKERESYAKFSLPIYTNKAVGVFALNEVGKKLSVFSSLKSIMESRQFKLGVIAGNSEGSYVDELIKLYPDQISEVYGRQIQLLKMLEDHRVDFILLPPEEVDVLTKEARVTRKFVLLEMGDIPEGNKRYIMYSKSVPQALIDRVNNAILESSK